MKLFNKFRKGINAETVDVDVVDDVQDADDEYIIETISYKPVKMTNELQRRKEEEALKKRYQIGVVRKSL